MKTQVKRNLTKSMCLFCSMTLGGDLPTMTGEAVRIWGEISDHDLFDEGPQIFEQCFAIREGLA